MIRAEFLNPSNFSSNLQFIFAHHFILVAIDFFEKLNQLFFHDWTKNSLFFFFSTLLESYKNLRSGVTTRRRLLFKLTRAQIMRALANKLVLKRLLFSDFLIIVFFWRLNTVKSIYEKNSFWINIFSKIVWRNNKL